MACARRKDVQSAEYLDAYFDAIFGVSIPSRGLSGQESRRVAISLARNLGSAAKLATVASDARLGEAGSRSAANKAAAHIAALEDLYVVEQVCGWDAPIRSRTRLRSKPKRYFADPSLAASLSQVSPNRLLEDGLLFESLCMHDLAVCASVLPGATSDALHYYRDSDGLEVDAIIEMRDGRWAALEVELGENQAGAAAASLRRLANKVAANPMARARRRSSSRSSWAQGSLPASTGSLVSTYFRSPVWGLRAIVSGSHRAAGGFNF